MKNSLGKTIRKQRKDLGITLKALSQKTSLSIGFLSEIERDISKPSMASLSKISQALGISRFSFVSGSSTNGMLLKDVEKEKEYDGKARNNISEIGVVRASMRKKLGYPDRPGFYELLTPDLNRKLEVLYVKIDPGFETGKEPLVDPPGEKFILVLSGEYSITINGIQYDLNTGDSIYYPANAEVKFANPGKITVELILVITPPGF